MRAHLGPRTITALLAFVALSATACGDGDGGDAGGPADGPPITVGSFNFPESVVLAEIYAQGLEDAGYQVERELNLGARELIFSDLESGNIDLLPEYVGSALSVGFGGEPTADAGETAELLQERFEEIEVTVLEPAEAENTNTFVVTREFAEEHGVEQVSDLADVEEALVIAGAPECEERLTCYRGLVEVYGLEDLEFQSIQEQPIRVESLRQGEVDIALLFSTDPVLQDEELVALEDDQGINPAENIVPVVRDEIVEAYGQDLIDLLDDITSRLRTETLIDLNARTNEGADPATVAGEWLREEGIVEGS